MSYMRIVLGMLTGFCDEMYIYLVSFELSHQSKRQLHCNTIGPTNTSKLYKFTSPADFAPHAKWIYRNQPNSRCFCRTCGGKRRQVLRPLLPPIGLVKNHEAKNDSLSCSSGSSITSIEGSQGAAPPKIYREGEVVWVSMLQAQAT
jgi:hypothetical protein